VCAGHLPQSRQESLVITGISIVLGLLEPLVGNWNEHSVDRFFGNSYNFQLPEKRNHGRPSHTGNRKRKISVTSSRAVRRRKWQRKELLRLFMQGDVLVASGPNPNRPGLSRLVAVKRSAQGTACVHVELFESTSWDDTLEETEHVFPSFDSALTWIEVEQGIHWFELHVPKPPPSIQLLFRWLIAATSATVWECTHLLNY
jgi:hypothetical protein